MRFIIPFLCVSLVGCTPGDQEAEQPFQARPSQRNLSGELPSMVTLNCDGSRQYRLYLSEGLWDWKDVGGWSPYSGIVEVTDAEIVLANGKTHYGREHYSLRLDRSDLNLVEDRSGPIYGMTVPPVAPRPKHFACAIAEDAND